METKTVFVTAFAAAAIICAIGAVFMLGCIDNCPDPERLHAGIALCTIGIAGLGFLAWLKR